MRSTDSDKYKRWMILDRLFRSEEPVSAIDVYKELNKVLKRVAKPNETNLIPNYDVLYRQDIHDFILIAEQNKAMIGIKNGKEIFESVRDEKDGRAVKRKYRLKGFSILPFVDRVISASDIKSLDKALRLLPPDIYDRLVFECRGRLEAENNLSRYIDYSSKRDLRGYYYLPILYRFIRERKVVLVDYENYFENITEFKFEPYQLKLFNDRWYCLGKRLTSAEGEAYHIPVDRISCLNEIEGSRATGSIDNPGYSNYFNDIVGVTKYRNGTQKESMERFMVMDGMYEIRFEVDDRYDWMRICTKPPHDSFKKIREYSENESGQASITVQPNIEMYSLFLTLGPNVRLISPLDVVEKMKEYIRRFTNTYNLGL